ncbi:MAG: 50S ribosomal protein L6 [Alphaproteobacteria bacterium TMED87]|nr:50S ribosomal protein L6 [Rhodospirillaceae bacterium]OUV08335.1 MAG: 50S ribosomal protein L6 [Alphaproteobacteria bacterium TMED87]|tara:strand:- start:704 stop:1237 length:534 start_codon:yes stop_codon:yes gene_type:complete
MSRIGKSPIMLPEGIEFIVDGNKLTVKGKRGELNFVKSSDIEVECKENQITTKPSNNLNKTKSLWGTTRSLIQNMVIGISKGFKKDLEIQGVGYKAQAKGKTLELSLGFSHDVTYSIPDGIDIKTPQPTHIHITGNDIQRVGQVAAEIRAYRPPEPYKGKGVRYKGENIIRKEGKKK